MPPLDTLLDIDSKLTDWLETAAANTDEERAQIAQVEALRTALDLQLNTLLAFRVQIAVANLPDAVAELGVAATAMQGVQKDISSVQTVLGALGTAVNVAAKFASVLA